jgi:hypothetical protein
MINRSLTMTTAVGIVFFDDEKGLQRCLSSIQAYVDLIIAIDGKFKHFEDDHDLSIDNSRKVVESFPNATYHCYPNLTEIDKRNKYLEIAGTKEIDFLLAIDSDEYAVIEMNEFSKNLAKIKEYKAGIVDGKTKDTPDVYGIKIFEKHFEKPDYIRERYIERIFYKPAKLRYQFIHCNLVDVDDPSRNFTTRKYTSEINGIILFNDDDRSNHYLQRSILYQSNLIGNEMAARKKTFA